MSDMEVALHLRAKDQASGIIKQVTTEARRQAEQVNRATTDVVTRATGEQTRLHQRAAQAREQLGIRSEKNIQREIQQTEAAYNRLARSGSLSAKEQERAFAAMTNKVKTLRSELGLVDRKMITLGQRAHNLASGMATVGAGVAAGAYAAAKPIGETMAYDRRLAMMANTAYSDSSVQGRQKGMLELDSAIVRAVRTGGGTREGAAETLDSMLASGALSQRSAMNILPALQKFSTATGADPKELANIAVRGMQTFGISEANLPKALDMAILAGQKGGFELKDMAKWLPQQMAAGRTAGLSGMSGFASLLAANQAAVITAGTKDEAGNNLVNLLAKINSADTRNDAKKLGIDLTGTLAKAKGNGVNGLDAFVGVVDHIVGKDPRFNELKKRAESAQGSEKQEALSGMLDIMEGSSIGKIIQDRQALMALLGVMNNRKYLKDIEKQLPNASGTGETNFQTISATDDFKVKQAANEGAIAKQKAMEGVNGAVGGSADWWTRFAREHPSVATATSGSVEAGKVVASAGGGALAMLLLQRYLTGTAGAAGAAAPQSAATQGLAARAASVLPGVGTVAAGAAPLAIMGGVTAWAGKESHSTELGLLTGLSKWLDGFIGKQAEFDARREEQLKSLMSTPIPVEVTVKVENGSIVASVNRVNQIMAGRF